MERLKISLRLPSNVNQLIQFPRLNDKVIHIPLNKLGKPNNLKYTKQ